MYGKHHSMARIDGSKRSVGLPLRRLRPAWAASAVRAFAVRRREAQQAALENLYGIGERGKDVNKQKQITFER